MHLANDSEMPLVEVVLGVNDHTFLERVKALKGLFEPYVVIDGEVQVNQLVQPGEVTELSIRLGRTHLLFFLLAVHYV